MAFVGLKRPVVGKLGTDGSYTDGVVLAKAVKASYNPTSNEAELFADDALAESDYTFAEAALSLEVDDLSDQNKAMVLGHTYQSGTISKAADDVAPYLGVAFYATVVKNNVTKYKGKFYKKCKFKLPSEEHETKGSSTSFSTTTLECKVMKPDTGSYAEEKTFDTEAACITWCNSCVNLSE